MNSGKVLTLTVVYCLSIVVLPSVASEHYSNSKYFREVLVIMMILITVVTMAMKNIHKNYINLVIAW